MLQLTISICLHNNVSLPGGSAEKICLQCKRYRFDPWVGKIPGKGNGNPVQYFCLENPMGREAWQVTIHGVSKESNTT